MSQILDRMNQMLSESAREARAATTKFVADSLSGAFGKPIRVKEWVDGSIRVLVPADDLRASGLVVVESAIDSVNPILSGNGSAIQNAERRIVKRLGEGWSAKLVDFDCQSRRAVFEVTRAVVQR